jgi:predicted Holliday junction resolvase-like endonuclease
MIEFFNNLFFLLFGFLIGLILSIFYFYFIFIPKKIEAERTDALKRSRAVLSGQISEQLAPYFPNFPFLPSEIRFIGKPIDFIVFEGLDQKEIKKIIFVEVKTSKSTLNKTEYSLKKAIEQKSVEWFEYRINQNEKNSTKK